VDEYDVDVGITDLIKRTVKTELRNFARDVAKATVQAVDEAGEPYSFGYSVLTIRFAEGSEPLAVSIPYLPNHNRTEINLDLRVVKAEAA
jgi:hypothetical protein